MSLEGIIINGTVKLDAPANLPDGTRVRVEPIPLGNNVLPSEDEAIRRIDAATTLDELFTAMNEAPDDVSYDLLAALNENRRAAGVPRLLIPTEDGGESW